MLFHHWLLSRSLRFRLFYPPGVHPAPFYDFHNCSALMASIDSFEVSPLTEKSRFVTPFRIHYRKNGVVRTWDGVKAHDGVSVLIYNKDRKSFAFVRQFRPAVYYAHLRKQEGENATSVASTPHTPAGQDGKPIILPPSLGETLELCAGIVDKAGKTLEEIAAVELQEECGYRVDPSRLRKITTVSASVGLSGTTASVFYVEVRDSDLDPSAGGGNPDEGEFIEVVYWPVARAEELLTLTETSISVSGITVLAVLWFQRHILPTL